MNTSPSALCEQLMQLLDKLRIAYVEVAEQNGLTKVQLFALYAIYSYGDEVPMGQVAGLLHCDASNVTGIVDRLAAQDLIIRRECLNDRRAKIITLTDKGRELITRLKATLPRRLGCAKLTDVERDDLFKLLQKICA